MPRTIDAGAAREDHALMDLSLAPTLPSFAGLRAGGVEHLALLAGVSFIESAATAWGAEGLLAWFRTYGSVMGRRVPPPTVTEAAVGTVPIAHGTLLIGDKVGGAEELPRLLAMARSRTVVALRGLLANPLDDRFLQAAIFAHRVVREDGTWAARLRDKDVLSDVVLALFAVSILSCREFHEENICICDVCGRVSFTPQLSWRNGCPRHQPCEPVLPPSTVRAPGCSAT